MELLNAILKVENKISKRYFKLRLSASSNTADRVNELSAFIDKQIYETNLSVEIERDQYFLGRGGFSLRPNNLYDAIVVTCDYYCTDKEDYYLRKKFADLFKGEIREVPTSFTITEDSSFLSNVDALWIDPTPISHIPTVSRDSITPESPQEPVFQINHERNYFSDANRGLTVYDIDGRPSMSISSSGNVTLNTEIRSDRSARNNSTYTAETLREALNNGEINFELTPFQEEVLFDWEE